MGLTAVEFVKGEYDPERGLLSLSGFRKRDPNSLIGLDQYELVLSEDRDSLAGFTRAWGKWDAIFSLERGE